MKKPKYRLFTILSVVFLILGILMTTVGGHFSTVLTVAMEGSTTDKETAEMTYADGLAMNVELEEEGLVLLKNENADTSFICRKSQCVWRTCFQHGLQRFRFFRRKCERRCDHQRRVGGSRTGSE